MEGQVGASLPPPGSGTASRRAKSIHLMCGAPLLGFAAAMVSAYLSYRSYRHVASGTYGWPHTWWTVATYGVWVVLGGAILSETRCLRERIFFGLVLLTFLIGLIFSLLTGVSAAALHPVRILSTALWGLAAVAGFATSFASTKPGQGGT